MVSCREPKNAASCTGAKPGPCYWAKSGPRAKEERCLTQGEYDRIEGKMMGAAKTAKAREEKQASKKATMQAAMAPMLEQRLWEELWATSSWEDIEKRRKALHNRRVAYLNLENKRKSPRRSPKKSSPKRNRLGRLSKAEVKKLVTTIHRAPQRKSAGQYTP